MPQFHVHESCCQEPNFGRNIDHCLGVIKQNKEVQETRAKETGASKDNSWRSAVSLPPRLYWSLEGFFKSYGEKLFNNDEEMYAFMKEFPQFRICKRI